ncbi:hypothetical protein FOZ60_014562 [Perkinsus olseni]|uniref:Uncharacterized protein n=1 Tax=Perkinsus olseni TaxID=32597 RepID=A0A7J6N7J2_PEROL|nr:hypothetical protein FOZ60_014562 [Perkinsus olseni]
MMDLFSTCLIFTSLFVTTTCQLSGEFATEVEGVRLAYHVDKDGDVSLSAEGPDGRRVRGTSFPLREVSSQLDTDGFFSTKYTVDFGRRRFRGLRQRKFLRPVSLLFPQANFENGDLTDPVFTDFGIVFASFQGQQLQFLWNTRTLSPGVFRFRETTGDLNEVTSSIDSDGRVEINFSCRGLEGVSAIFSLEEGRFPYRLYFTRSTRGISIVTFRQDVVELCGIDDFDGERADRLFRVLAFADEDRVYMSYPIPGRNSILLPLDRIVN